MFMFDKIELDCGCRIELIDGIPNITFCYNQRPVFEDVRYAWPSYSIPHYIQTGSEFIHPMNESYVFNEYLQNKDCIK